MFNESFVAGFIAGFFATVLLCVVFGLLFAIVRPWLRLIMSGGHGSIIQILAMRLRGTPPMLVVDAYTSLLHAGEDVSLMLVESQYVVNRAKIRDSRTLINEVREHLQRRELAREKAATDMAAEANSQSSE